MEVGTRQGVCNNSPAELVGPENGWRCSVQPTPGRLGKRGGACLPSLDEAETSRRVAAVSAEALDASLGAAAAGADLGGSSKYSSENLEGRSGEGFRVAPSIGRGLVGPKAWEKSYGKRDVVLLQRVHPMHGPKGKRVRIPVPEGGAQAATQRRSGTPSGESRRVNFSF